MFPLVKKYSALVTLFLFSCIIFSKLVHADTAKRPNFVWLLTEDNSKHYLKLYDPQGATMPNVESLANEGMIFNQAFSNAAVCSTARTTLATGSYTPRLAMNYHRPYLPAKLPEGLKPISLFLKDAGYYTSNDAKTDYNFLTPDKIWDKSARKASWRDRQAGQPFFHMQTFHITHEGQLHFPKEDVQNVATKHNPHSIELPPIYPNTELFKYTYARTLDNHLTADKQIGEVLNKLKEDNLMDDTFIFYFGDHGGVLPASKGYLFERGLHVPLIVYVPKNFRHLLHKDMQNLKHAYIDGFVSFIDFAPTLMKLAGLPASDKQDGQSFLGEDISLKELKKRDTTLGYADRFDEKYDVVRSLRKGKYKYIRHYQPFNPDGLFNAYRYKNQALKQWQGLYKAGKLNSVQASFFESSPVEALFDVEKDPYEIENLASRSEYQHTLINLRKDLSSRLKAMPDLGFYPESWQVENALSDSANFAKNNQAEIAKLIDIADLQLQDFTTVKNQLKIALQSPNQWHRYWALISLSRFNKEAIEFSPLVKKIMTSDNNLLNRARAAEYLAITEQINGKHVLESLVAKSQKSVEALEIMNIATLLHDTQGTVFNFPMKASWQQEFQGELNKSQQKTLEYWFSNRINHLNH